MGDGVEVAGLAGCGRLDKARASSKSGRVVGAVELGKSRFSVEKQGGQQSMSLTWNEIHVLEETEDYPAAIDALEARLQADPAEREAVIRLGFNLWYAVVEASRMGKQLPTEKYAARFMELFREYQSQFDGDADFCWAYGLGISLFWFQFPGADEALGESLVARAMALDSFYVRMEQTEVAERFAGRGIFANYYATALPITGANAG